MKVIKKGSKCNEVKIQQTLLGLDPDGMFGEKTKEAVIEYQNSKGLAADGIVGIKTWAELKLDYNNKLLPVEKEETAIDKTIKQPIDYKQTDSRWRSVVYTSVGNKSQTIGNSGCGPTAMADIVATVKNSAVTPATLAKFFVKNGFRTANNGTSYGAFEWTKNKFCFSDMVKTKTADEMKKCLDKGGYIVCNMGKGYWTKGGHYICLWKYDDEYFYCNDPASTTRKKQKIYEFMKEQKYAFCFYE